MRNIFAAFLIFAAGVTLVAAIAAETQPEDAISGIVAKFDQYSVVAIAETNHGLQQAGDFYISLVKDPRFTSKVNYVVIEFASRSSQPIIDRYISGENVPPGELQHVWQDSTKVLSWESPIYRNLLTAVREVNRTLPARHRLRVLAGDSPIDWSKIHTNEEWSATQPNDKSFSWVLVNDVVKAHHKALIILGANHLTRDGNAWGEPDTTTMVEDQVPGSMYVVMLYSAHAPVIPDAKQHMASWQAPSIFPMKGTWLGPISMGGRSLQSVADALLYLGPAESITSTAGDRSSLDPAYLQEVARRSKVVYGCDFDANSMKEGRGPCQQAATPKQ